LLPMFKGMPCFDIAHSKECQNLFTTVFRNGKEYIRSIPLHKVVQDLEELYEKYLPRRSSCGRPRLVQEDQEEVPHTPPARTTNRRSTQNSIPPPTNKIPPRKRSPNEMTPPRQRTHQGSQRKRVIRTSASRKRKRSSR